jgi:excisionase family DNA binding protein
MSARQAAAYCGVSDKTIRRWIAAGRLAAARDGHDFQISREALDAVRGPGRIQAADNVAGDAAPAADSRAASAALGAAAAAQGAALVELVARQEQTILELAGRVGWLQAELQQRDEQLKALQAPQPEPTVEPASAIAAAEEPPRGPWRRLWRWMLATG